MIDFAGYTVHMEKVFNHVLSPWKKVDQPIEFEDTYATYWESIKGRIVNCSFEEIPETLNEIQTLWVDLKDHLEKIPDTKADIKATYEMLINKYQQVTSLGMGLS